MVNHISGLKTRKHKLLADREKQFLFTDLVTYQAWAVGGGFTGSVTPAPSGPWEEAPARLDVLELELRPPSDSQPSGHNGGHPESTRWPATRVRDPEIGASLGFQ